MIGIVFVFELTGSYINEYTSYFSCINVESNDKYSVNDLMHLILENLPEDIDVFVATAESRSEVKTEMLYYSDSDVRKILVDEYNIKPGVYRSVFSSDVEITYKDLLSVETENNFVPMYFLGNVQDIKSFVDSINTELDLDLKLTEPYNLNRSNQKVFIIWCVIDFLLLVLTVYDVAYQKKEVVIKAIYGESILSIVIKNILIDLLINFLSVFTLISILKLFYGNFIFERQTLLSFLIFIFFNSLIYFFFFKINLKKDLSGCDSGYGILHFSYFLKFLSTGITFALLLITLTSFIQSFQLVNSSKMYNDFSNKSFVQVIPDELSGEDYFAGIEKLESVINQIYLDKFETAEPILLSKDFEFDNNCYGVLANKYAEKYVIDSFSEIKDADITFFVREEYKDKSVLTNLIDSYTLNGLLSSEIVYYSNIRTISVLNDQFMNENLSVENPLLVYFNIEKNKWDLLLKRKSDSISNSFRNIAFNSDSISVKRLTEDYNLNNGELIITGFSEQYREQFEIAVLKTAANVILLILTLLFYIQITNITLSMKIRSHGKEFAVKKVNGYSDFQLYFHTTVVDLIIYITCIIGIIIFMNFENISISIIILSVGVIVTLIIELVSFLYMLKKICVDRVQKILKGGIN